MPYNGVKADIWSLGIILYIMNAGMRPFSGNTFHMLYHNITRINYRTPDHFSNGFNILK